MDISQVGINLIKSFEGLSLKAYKVDGANEKYWTIGYGHYGSDVKEGQTITAQKAEELLKKDLKKYVDGVDAAIKVKVNQYQFDACVSFAYNLGVSAFTNSDLCEYINAGKFDKAAGEFGKWVHAGGNVLKGLVRRREAERVLFLKHVEAPKPKLKPKKYLSIVDYLKAHKMPSDFVSRRKLAEKHGIRHYSGSAAENTKLLDILQGGK
jgi:GH24 family phage-related lysozyme (muramidase)